MTAYRSNNGLGCLGEDQVEFLLISYLSCFLGHKIVHIFFHEYCLTRNKSVNEEGIALLSSKSTFGN